MVILWNACIKRFSHLPEIVGLISSPGDVALGGAFVKNDSFADGNTYQHQWKVITLHYTNELI